MSNKKHSRKMIALISAAAVLVIAASVSCVYVYSSSKIYSRVSCTDVSLSGMSANQAEEALKSRYGEEPPAGKINLLLDGKERSLYTDDIGVKYSYDKTAAQAYMFGREGNIFRRLGTVIGTLFTGHNMPLFFDYDEKLLDDAIASMLEGIGTPVTEYSYEVRDNKLFITNGTPGDMPNSDDIKKNILEAVGKRSFDAVLEFDKEKRIPKRLTAEELYSELCGDAKDAEFVKIGNDVSVTEHRYGIDFDKKRAKDIINDNQEYGKTFEIPAEIKMPALTTEMAKDRLFTKTLGSYKSNYNSGDVSRSSNIALAASLVNNKVLMPGEEFSYNDTVGERTPSAGFKIAHVYMNNEVADGIGGGICQVSSTLYCAALYANLEITARTCHQLPVTYVPLGQDATVDYGNIDFKFKNNTPYPLKISASAGGGTVYASILGYKDVDEKVELYPVRTGTVAPSVTEEPDDTLPIGEKKVEKEGSSGCTVETYKTVTKDGVTGERTLVSRSTYAGGKTIVKVGTKKPEEKTPEAGDAPSASQTPATAMPTLPPATPAPSQTLQPTLMPQLPNDSAQSVGVEAAEE